MISNIKKYFEGITRECFKEILTEAKSNLPFNEFRRDMEKMGFTYSEKKGSSKMFTTFSNGTTVCITVHVHNDNDSMDANALRQVKKSLADKGWFNNPENYAKFPFEKWGINSKNIETNLTQDDNEKYKNANLTPISNKDKSSAFIMMYNDKFNTCPSSDNRQPILPQWYDRLVYDNTSGKPMFELDDYEKMETRRYPINNDGSLDNENMVISENKKHGKKRL